MCFMKLLTLDDMEEVLHCTLITPERLFVVFGFVLRCSFGGEIDSFLRTKEEVHN